MTWNHLVKSRDSVFNFLEFEGDCTIEKIAIIFLSEFGNLPIRQVSKSKTNTCMPYVDLKKSVLLKMNTRKRKHLVVKRTAYSLFTCQIVISIYLLLLRNC